MRNKCSNFAKKLMEHLWILMSWLINAVCGIAAFIYRKNSEKTAIIILIEKLLISLTNLLAVLNTPICCKIKINKANKDPIEEAKKILSIINLSGNTFKKLKELATNGNKDAEELLNNLNLAGQTMINNLNLIKK